MKRFLELRSGAHPSQDCLPTELGRHSFALTSSTHRGESGRLLLTAVWVIKISSRISRARMIQVIKPKERVLCRSSYAVLWVVFMLALSWCLGVSFFLGLVLFLFFCCFSFRFLSFFFLLSIRLVFRVFAFLFFFRC